MPNPPSRAIKRECMGPPRAPYDHWRFQIGPSDWIISHGIIDRIIDQMGHRPMVHFFSYGAPVPEEPTNNLLPSGKVMSFPFALFESSLARYPSTRISVPGVSESFVNPRLISDPGGPPSIIQRVTLPSGPLTSMWIQEWGLTHSILTTVPFRWTGLSASNSAENA